MGNVTGSRTSKYKVRKGAKVGVWKRTAPPPAPFRGWGCGKRTALGLGKVGVNDLVPMPQKSVGGRDRRGSFPLSLTSGVVT